MGLIARQSIKAAISNYIGVLLGFINLFILFPLFFSPRDLGALRLLLELGAVISSFALIGTNYSVNRFFPYFKTEDQKHNGFFFWVISIPLIGYTIVLISLLLFKDTLIGYFRSDTELLQGLYPMLLVLILCSLFQTILESATANHGRIAFTNFLREVVLRSLLLVAGFLFFTKIIGFESTLWVIVASYGLMVIINFVYLRRLTRIHLKPDLEFLKQNPEIRTDALKFTAWLFLSSVTALIVNKIDFIMVSATRSLSDTAIYSTGFYLALLIEIPKRTLLQISTPIIAGFMKMSDFIKVEKIYRQLATNQLLIACIILFAIWLNIDNLFQIMPKGEFYKTGKLVVLIIGIGRLADMIGSTASPIMANSKYYAWGFFNSLVSISVAIFSNYLLIPIMGINGAAVATFFTFFLSQGVSIFIIYKKNKIHPFSINQIRILAIFCIFMATTLTGKWLTNPFIDGFIRTGIFLPALIYIYFKIKVSEDFNTQIIKLIETIKKRLR